MPARRRQTRFLVWTLVVVGLALTPAITRAGFDHARAVALVWQLAGLSTMLWLLASTRGHAIKLPVLVTELVVLGVMIGTHLWLFGRPGLTPVIAGLILLVNHGATGRVAAARPRRLLGRFSFEPAFNLWPLAPMLWHPALWASSGSWWFFGRPAWIGLGLWIVAGLGASFALRRPGPVQLLGWAIWIAAGVLTVAYAPG